MCTAWRDRGIHSIGGVGGRESIFSGYRLILLGNGVVLTEYQDAILGPPRTSLFVVCTR
jgi:hypothetical protein